MRQYRHRSPHPTPLRSRREADAEEPARHPLQSLQQRIGNRAVLRLLRAPGVERAIARAPDEGQGSAASACALTTYSGSNFKGDKVVADVEFVPALEAINQHAADNDVDLLVTDSFRPHGRAVKGAIVPPASRSNHLAGNAIDMNVLHGQGKQDLCNSGCLGRKHPPAPVKAFIEAIRGDGKLRWGGDFSPRDPVHIDDDLNADDAAWRARYVATQKAHRDGCP